MRKLISFLVRYFTVILFLLLQVVAFVLIYQSQPYQHSAMYSINAEWTGRTLEAYNNVEDYFNLGRINKSLATENAALKSANKKSYFSLFAVRDTTVDTLYEQRYSFLEARVINSSFSKRNNYITLNRGSLHGVKPDMAVISSEGAIGVIKDVSRHFSTIIPIIHSRSLVSVDFKNNPYFGPMSWDGSDYRIAQLNDIPRETPFKPGDTLVTSVRSLSFPAGVPVGTVFSDEQNPEDLSYRIEVKLSVDFAALSYVYIVDNLMRAEQEELEEKLEE